MQCTKSQFTWAGLRRGVSISCLGLRSCSGSLHEEVSFSSLGRYKSKVTCMDRFPFLGCWNERESRNLHGEVSFRALKPTKTSRGVVSMSCLGKRKLRYLRGEVSFSSLDCTKKRRDTLQLLGPQFRHPRSWVLREALPKACTGGPKRCPGGVLVEA